MTRLMRRYRRTHLVFRVTPVLRFSGVNLPLNSDKFKWPSLHGISNEQNNYADKAPSNASRNESRPLLIIGVGWIPDESVDLKLRLLSVAHDGSEGHHGADSIHHASREYFTWTDQREDLRSFVSSCLLCVLFGSDNKVPRLISTAFTLQIPAKWSILITIFLMIPEKEWNTSSSSRMISVAIVGSKQPNPPIQLTHLKYNLDVRAASLHLIYASPTNARTSRTKFSRTYRRRSVSVVSYKATGVTIFLLLWIQGSFLIISNLDVSVHVFFIHPVKDSLTLIKSNLP